MTHEQNEQGWCCCGRREFLQALGAMGAISALSAAAEGQPAASPSVPRQKSPASIRGAFLYPPTERLRAEGYWSWPGSGFDAEGRQVQYTHRLREIEKKLGIQLAIDEKPLDEPASVDRFLAGMKQSPPDGLLLIPFKKSHWEHVGQIIEKTKIPAVVLATLGVLLSDQIRQLHGKAGVYSISSLDDLDAVEEGLNMVRTASWMRDARLLSINGNDVRESTVPHLGTQVRTIPNSRFYEEYKRLPAEGPVRELAAAYKKNAKAVVEPSDADILDAARCYYVFKRLIQSEHADAIMMNCLPGLRHPRQHVPPCMGFMSLRDEGIPIGCQADLSATLSLMLVQQLFGKPGFQQNASMDTRNNLYFGSHCTSPTRMNGPDQPAEPYILRSHAEAGWGCVPRVLFKKDQDLTIAQYVPAEKPKMHVYTGKVVECPEIPPAGGCRTNVKMTIAEVDDVCDVQGMHQTIFYGNHKRQLRAFCQLYGIEAVS